MAILLNDSNGVPMPQYLKRDGTAFESSKGANGGFDVNVLAMPALPAGTNNIGSVSAIDPLTLGVLTSAGAGSTATASPNDTTVFPDISNVAAKGVQVYVTASVPILAIIIDAKFDTDYFPILLVKPDVLLTGLKLTGILSPKVNGMLPATWRIRVITATSVAPTLTANYQYIL